MNDQIRLQCRADGSFKAVQVTDLHFILLPCPAAEEFLLDLARREQPDLFILTGDNITDNVLNLLLKPLNRRMVRHVIDRMMGLFDRIYRDYGIPVTMVFGNHDAEAAGITRREQFAMYAAHPSFIGAADEAADAGTRSQKGPHYGSHCLPVTGSNGETAVFNLWMFDSGDYAPDRTRSARFDCVQRPQVEWYKAQNAATGTLPSLAFQHIIVREALDFMKNASPGKHNYGQYEALCEGGCLAVFSGHDHDNSFALRLPGTDIVNTPATGLNCNCRSGERGARVITLNEQNPGVYSTRLVTYREFCESSKLRRARLRFYTALRNRLDIVGFSLAAVVDLLVFRPLLLCINPDRQA